MSRLKAPIIGLALAVGLLFIAPLSRADVVELQPDHPDRYVVVKGDTLWDIATRFLKSPWHWPRIWKINEQIANPHLIYPGDVILLRWVDGQPQLTVLRKQPVAQEGAPPAEVVEEVTEGITVQQEQPAGPRRAIGGREKLKPGVRSQLREEAIPTIRPEVIAPFLTRPLVVEDDILEDAGYVLIGEDDRRALGAGSVFYARDLRNKDEEFYFVFRQGKRLQVPGTGKHYGYEAVYLGDAKLISHGETSKLILSETNQEVLPGDRLLPVKKVPPIPQYQPRSPDKDVDGVILLARKAIAEFGPLTVVAINLGKRHGLEKGHVLRIWRHVGKVKDPVDRSFKTVPDEESGILMVFETFDQISYGLIMRSDKAVHLGDRVTKP